MVSKKNIINFAIFSIALTILMLFVIGAVFADTDETLVSSKDTVVGTETHPSISIDPNGPIQTDPNAEDPAPVPPVTTTTPVDTGSSGGSGGGGGGGSSYSSSSSSSSTNTNSSIKIQNSSNTNKTLTSNLTKTNITEEKDPEQSNSITGAAIGSQIIHNKIIIAAAIFMVIILLTYFFLHKIKK
jgi:hypothetical protein